MSLQYYDWGGRYKLVNLNGGYTVLCGMNVRMNDFCVWWNETYSRFPSVVSVYEVDAEFFEEWKDLYSGKTLFYEGDEGDSL